MTDGNLRALNHHLAEREEYDAWQEGQDAIEAMTDAEDRIAELEAERDALQAKLSLVIEMALEECPYYDCSGAYNNWWHDRRTALAELKETNHDT